MRCNCATSASRGTLSRMRVSSVSSPAIISGNAAFFAPEMAMVPLSLLPPTIRMRSILNTPVVQRTIKAGKRSQQPEYLRLFDGWAAATVIPAVIPGRAKREPGSSSL